MDKKLIQKKMKIFLEDYSWQVFAHLSFQTIPNQSPYYAKNKVNTWLTQLSKRFRIRLAAIYVVAYKSSVPHVHALISGINKNGSSLIEVAKISSLEKFWEFGALVEKVKSQPHSSGYVSSHYSLFRCKECELDIYGLKLLEKFKKN